MRLEIIEALLIISIISLQIYAFVSAINRINKFKYIIPNTISIRVLSFSIPAKDLETRPTQEIIADGYNRNNSTTQARESQFLDHSPALDLNPSFSHIDQAKRNEPNASGVEINLLENKIKTNQIFERIIFSLNDYLIKNRNCAIDFNLLKDIVERNLKNAEANAKRSLNTPLYIGLAAVMTGMLFALFLIPDFGVQVISPELKKKLDSTLNLTVISARTAVVTSLTGLIFAFANSNWLYKSSKIFNEARKNDFYTFIQLELLPKINQSQSAASRAAQMNASRLDTELMSKLSELIELLSDGVPFGKTPNYSYNAIDAAKVAEMTQQNIKVLQQLDLSVGQFMRFDTYIHSVNSFIEKSILILNKANEILARTDNFKVIAHNLEARLEQSQQLITFLSAHFNKLDEFRGLTSNAVADVGHAIAETFKELKQHIENSSDHVKQFTIHEMEAIKEALSSNKTNLRHLEHLTTLKDDVSVIKTTSETQVGGLKSSIDELNKNLFKFTDILIQLEQKKSSGILSRLSKSTKNLNDKN